MVDYSNCCIVDYLNFQFIDDDIKDATKVFFSFNFYAIYETKKKFATYGYDINKEYYVDNFYQNEYYGSKRNFLLKIINLIWNEN